VFLLRQPVSFRNSRLSDLPHRSFEIHFHLLHIGRAGFLGVGAAWGNKEKLFADLCLDFPQVAGSASPPAKL
jgi:hypothetical protein